MVTTLPINEITPESKDWTCKVQVVDKGHPHDAQRTNKKFQLITFQDEEVSLLSQATGHKCGCLPILPKLVMKQLVSRLDAAMFNAILHESTEEMPTDPIFDPVGTWSRWLTDLIGFEDEDSPEYNNIFGNDKKLESFKVFRFLNALSNLMMLPFEMLKDASTRKEVCLILGPDLIKRILDNFVPDEFRPDQIPQNVLEALDSEAMLKTREKTTAVNSAICIRRKQRRL